MRTTSDTLVVTFDDNLKDKASLIFSRVVKRKVVFVKVEVGEQADILYRLLTDQTAKAEIKAESEGKE